MLLHETDQTRAAVLDELHSSRQWLLNELSAVTFEHDVSIVDADPVALQRVLIRRVPEVCALMSQLLLSVSPGDGELLVEAFFEHPWLQMPALRQVAEAMEEHWIRYLPYLHNWHGWEAAGMYDALDLDLEIQSFRNPVDGRIVADFVGLVDWPDGQLAELDAVQAAYLRDAQRVFETLEAEWGWEFLALRCLTPARDGLAVHWLQPDLTEDEALAAIDALTPECRGRSANPSACSTEVKEHDPSADTS